jgi:Leucine-rich repeat (LRR) protein
VAPERREKMLVTEAKKPETPARSPTESPLDKVAALGGKVERTGTAVTRVDLFSTDTHDADLDILKAFPDLKALSLASTKVTDAGLERLQALPKLEELSLNFTDVTDKGLAALAKLKELQKLSLLQTKVTPFGVQDLQKALPRLQVSQ